VTQPHPPILVGGGGEKRTLLLVARYADACNLFTGSPSDVAQKLDVLRRHCDDEGRDYDSITKTALHVGLPVLDNIDQFLADAEQYAELGFSELEVMPDRNPADFATNLAERVVPRLNAIG
jgi:alkanesulfonate monooxygenase SsuD/methylene tetrahydromethanopterin reductase-like flavin-dependent oxidoreductase (luciferase family)